MQHEVKTMSKLTKFYKPIMERGFVEAETLEEVMLEKSKDFQGIEFSGGEFKVYSYLLYSVLEYGFELNASGSQSFIMTPITQRATFNLFTAVSSTNGALIYGNQGSGKTETIRNFSKMLARPLILWNCQGQSTTQTSISRLCTGMAKGGYWICLDDLDSLDLCLLSTFVQNIL